MSLSSFREFVRTQAEDAKPKFDCYNIVTNAVKHLRYNLFWVKNCFDHPTAKDQQQVITKLEEIQKIETDNYENYIQVLQDKIKELKNITVNSIKIQIKINQFINNITFKITQIQHESKTETKSEEVTTKTITLFVQNLISLHGMVKLSTSDDSYVATIREADFLSPEIQNLLPLSLSAIATGNFRQCVHQLKLETLEKLQETIEAKARGIKVSLVR